MQAGKELESAGGDPHGNLDGRRPFGVPPHRFSQFTGSFPLRITSITASAVMRPTWW